jgi:FkbM family methyltransferase
MKAPSRADAVGCEELRMNWRFLYRGLKARYVDQQQELSALTGALSPEDVAIDVGANKGSYLWSLSRAAPRGRVVAFEPQPVLATYLAEACKACGLRNVVVEAAGVSREAGVATLAIPGSGASSPGASFESSVSGSEPCRLIDVPTICLDDYFAGEKARIGAMKIDVEGHEFSVLAGAARLIETHRPTVVLECEARHLVDATVSDVLGFMTSRNYAGYFVHRSKKYPISQFDLAVHQKHDGDRFWDSPDYCNNFVFAPR